MCARSDSLPPWWVARCGSTSLVVFHGSPLGTHWACSPLSQCHWPGLLRLFPADTGRPSSPSSITGTCEVRQRGILPCGSPCTMYPIPTRTYNIWCWRPIPEIRKLVPGHHYGCPGLVLLLAPLLPLALCAPQPVAVDKRVACLLVSRHRLANTLHVGILIINHCTY